MQTMALQTLQVALVALAVVASLPSATQAHSYLCAPTSRSNQCSQLRGDVDGPCDAPAGGSGNTPSVTIQRGETVDLKWPRNNHPGGIIRLAWAPTANSDDPQAFENGVQQWSCNEQPCNEQNQCDNHINGGCTPCSTQVQVPVHLTDGQWTLQWRWYSGGFGLKDYYSCVDYTVLGGPTAGASDPAPLPPPAILPPSTFVGGDATYEHTCWTCSTCAHTSLPDAFTLATSHGVPEELAEGGGAPVLAPESCEVSVTKAPSSGGWFQLDLTVTTPSQLPKWELTWHLVDADISTCWGDLGSVTQIGSRVAFDATTRLGAGVASLQCGVVVPWGAPSTTAMGLYPGSAYNFALNGVTCHVKEMSSSGGAASSVPCDHTIVGSGVVFSPTTVDVALGDNVCWQWDDTTVHNIIQLGPAPATEGAAETFFGPAGIFSGAPDFQGTSAWRMDSEGTFRYGCEPHLSEGMVAELVVVERSVAVTGDGSDSGSGSDTGTGDTGSSDTGSSDTGDSTGSSGSGDGDGGEESACPGGHTGTKCYGGQCVEHFYMCDGGVAFPVQSVAPGTLCKDDKMVHASACDAAPGGDSSSGGSGDSSSDGGGSGDSSSSDSGGSSDSDLPERSCEGGDGTFCYPHDCCTKYYTCWHDTMYGLQDVHEGTLCYDGQVVHPNDARCVGVVCDYGGGSDTGSSDTGSSDTGSSDTGSSDTGSSDTGSSDTGSSDTGSSDTGSSDTGSSDTGSDSGAAPVITCDSGDGTFCYPHNCCPQYYTCWHSTFYGLQNSAAATLCFDGQVVHDYDPRCVGVVCGADTGSSDTGSSDTGSSDTGSSDTGSSDTGSSDTGSSDTGSSDTGSSDTGSSDTGSSDTGSSDTGSSDTGSSDTGTSDTGSSDTGDVPPDDAPNGGQETTQTCPDGSGTYCWPSNCCPEMYQCSGDHAWPTQTTAAGTVCYAGQLVAANAPECEGVVCLNSGDPNSEGGNPDDARPVVCGDGLCDVEEGCEACAQDCGSCPPTCGNDVCDTAETCATCVADCGTCSSEPPIDNDSVNTASGSRKLVAYYTNWAQYRSAGGGVYKFFPENIDATMLTHIVYGFATVEDLTYDTVPFEWNDVLDYADGMYVRFNRHVRQQNPNIKTLIAVGGWNFNENWSTKHIFTTMAGSAETRARFINHAITFCRTHGFDGYDIDWEYPSNWGQGGRPVDKSNFVLLLKEFRHAINTEPLVLAGAAPPLLLTIAVAAGESNVDAGYDVPNIHPYVDWVGLMSYDLHGSWESRTNPHTPLHTPPGADARLTVSYAIDLWLDRGTAPEKLVVGLATYGRSWTLTAPVPAGSPVAPASTLGGVGALASGAGDKGTYTAAPGFLATYEIDQMVESGGTLVYEGSSQTYFAVKGDQWVGFDKPLTITYKIDHAIAKQLGGAMVWALDLDDFLGGYPLIRAAAQRLFASTAEGSVALSLSDGASTSRLLQPRGPTEHARRRHLQDLSPAGESLLRAELSAQLRVPPDSFRFMGAVRDPETGVTHVTLQFVETFVVPASVAKDRLLAASEAGTLQLSSFGPASAKYVPPSTPEGSDGATGSDGGTAGTGSGSGGAQEAGSTPSSAVSGTNASPSFFDSPALVALLVVVVAVLALGGGLYAARRWMAGRDRSSSATVSIEVPKASKRQKTKKRGLHVSVATADDGSGGFDEAGDGGAAGGSTDIHERVPDARTPRRMLEQRKYSGLVPAGSSLDGEDEDGGLSSSSDEEGPAPSLVARGTLLHNGKQAGSSYAVGAGAGSSSIIGTSGGWMRSASSRGSRLRLPTLEHVPSAPRMAPPPLDAAGPAAPALPERRMRRPHKSTTMGPTPSEASIATIALDGPDTSPATNRLRHYTRGRGSRLQAGPSVREEVREEGDADSPVSTASSSPSSSDEADVRLQMSWPRPGSSASGDSSTRQPRSSVSRSDRLRRSRSPSSHGSFMSTEGEPAMTPPQGLAASTDTLIQEIVREAEARVATVDIDFGDDSGDGFFSDSSGGEGEGSKDGVLTTAATTSPANISTRRQRPRPSRGANRGRGLRVQLYPADASSTSPSMGSATALSGSGSAASQFHPHALLTPGRHSSRAVPGSRMKVTDGNSPAASTSLFSPAPPPTSSRALGGVNALAQSGASTSSSSGGAAGAAGGRRDDDGALGAAMVGFPSPRARGERLAKQTGQPQSGRPT